MSQNTQVNFEDGVRVSHTAKGLGTIARDPQDDGLVVSRREESRTGRDMVYVVWDDDRLPVGKVPADELELVPPAAEAITSGV